MAAQATATYTVTVTDTNGATATAAFSLTVNSAVAATTAISAKALTVDDPASPFIPVVGSGGTGALAYTVSPSLPAGLVFNASTGQITGTPTATQSAISYTVTVTDANNVRATANFSLSVNSVATATTLTASAQSGLIGQPIALKAKVSPSVSVGTVTFQDGGAPLCSNVAVASGNATCNARFSSAGVHSLTATYSGGGSYAGSTSAALQVSITDQTVKTVQTIGKFLSQRTNQILSNEPDANRQINRLQEAAGAVAGAGGPAASTTAMLTPAPSHVGDGISGNDFSRMALGAQGNNNRRLGASLPISSRDDASPQGSLPIAMNGSDEGPLHLGFATSLHDMQQATQQASQKKEGLGGAALAQPAFNPWDVWFEGTYSRFDDNQDKADLKGHFGLFTGGVDYVVNPSLLVGVLVQVDTMTQKSEADQSSASGTGWMAGPLRDGAAHEAAVLAGARCVGHVEQRRVAVPHLLRQLRHHALAGVDEADGRLGLRPWSVNRLRPLPTWKTIPTAIKTTLES